MKAHIYLASWMLPVTAEPVANAALLVDERGRIAFAGARADLSVSGDVATTDFGNAILLPGLINVHAHPELTALRGLLDDLPFHEWIPALMRCKRGAQLDFDDYVAAARWTCVESLRAGVTTLGATEDSGAAVIALSEAGMRGTVYLETFGPAPDQAAAAMAELRAKVERFAPHAGNRLRIGVSPHAPYTVSDVLYDAVARYAHAESLPVAVHAAEAEAEELLLRLAAGPFAAGLRTRGIETNVRAGSTIELLARTGIMDCAPLLIHALRLSDDDIARTAQSGAAVAHCPIANARLGHGIARVVELRAAGITVALGTDSVASNNRLDILEEGRVAQLLQRARLQSASALSAPELLRMATIEGAHALGVADRVGSLEIGKDADLCVVSLAGPHTVPAPVPESALFHSARGSDVIMTAVGGEILFLNGDLRVFDQAQLELQMRNMAARLQSARDQA